MALKANYEFLFVGRDDNSFLENYAYDLFQDHGEKGGQVFVNLEIQNNPADAEDIAQSIFQTMQQVFFEDVEEDSYKRFEFALKAVNETLLKFKKEKMSGYIGNLNIIISAIIGDTLYLAQSGDAEAYLVRKRYVSVVSEGLSDESSEEEVFSTIASGQIEEGDVVLFSSTRLLRYISKGDLGKALKSIDIAGSLDEVKDFISTEMLGRVGMTGIGFSESGINEFEENKANEDKLTETIMESSATKEVSEKRSVSGKFFSFLKNRKKSRTEVFQGGDGVFSKMKSWFSGFFNGIFSKGFGKDKVLALLILFILVLVVGIVVAKDRSAERKELERLNTVLIDIQDKISEAETKGSYDKESAKQILDQAYIDAMSVLNSGYFREKANLYLLQIEDARDDLDNVQRVENPNLLVDLSTKRSDINALGFAEVNDRLFVYEYNALYELVVDQVQDPLTIDDEETVIAATGFDDRNSVVFLTKTGKLIEYKDGTMSFMDTDEGSFHKSVAIDDWSNRIYLLDATNSQIWKYSYKGTRETFGEAEPYLSEEVDLSSAKDFAIDANVYALLTSGDILKFYAGTKAEFYIDNPPFDIFKEPSVIYTNEKLDEIYVLDAQEARIFVYLKDSRTGNINYSTQYLIDGVGDLRDIYVDPDSRKLYVLSASKVFEVSL